MLAAGLSFVVHSFHVIIACPDLLWQGLIRNANGERHQQPHHCDLCCGTVGFKLLLLFRPVIRLDGCQLICLFMKLQLCCDSRAMPMQTA
jgi:hypothetical protein